MAKMHFQGEFSGSKFKVNVGLTLYFWEEDSFSFVYSPALDITGYGKNEDSAKKSFEYTLEEFIKYTHNKKTFFDELERLGWTVNRKKKRINAPNIDELISDNKTFKDLLTKSNIRKESREVVLAI